MDPALPKAAALPIVAGKRTDEPDGADTPLGAPSAEETPAADAAPAHDGAPEPDPPPIESALSQARDPGAAAPSADEGPLYAAEEEPADAPFGEPAPETAEVPVGEEPAPLEHGIGVLLVNLGTPDAADRKAVHRYLKEFLSDRRVIENDSRFWRAVLHGAILPTRARRRARDYRKIWDHARGESPFKTITRSQAEKLAVALEPFGQHVVVDWAMRYASPSIRSRLEALLRRGCDRILIMPLYPQYAAATTATACDEVFRFMMNLRKQPALRVLPAYYEDAPYIEALASSLEKQLKELSFTPEVILASYHGMPRELVDKGDPYESQCVRTTELLRQRLGLDENKLMMSFQSRFGRGHWLEPYTIKTVKALAKRKVTDLAVITPGFSADCLETLEEIAVDNARMFKRHGGKNFAVISCLNDGKDGMQLIRQLALRELKGWL